MRPILQMRTVDLRATVTFLKLDSRRAQAFPGLAFFPLHQSCFQKWLPTDSSCPRMRGELLVDSNSTDLEEAYVYPHRHYCFYLVLSDKIMAFHYEREWESKREKLVQLMFFFIGMRKFSRYITREWSHYPIFAGKFTLYWNHPCFNRRKSPALFNSFSLYSRNLSKSLACSRNNWFLK